MTTKGLVLGHIVSKEGIQVDKREGRSDQKLPIPRTVRDIQSFLKHEEALLTFHQ